MDLGFEGCFTVFKESINTKLNKDWIQEEYKNTYLLKKTMFETVFANDILNYAKAAWVPYFKQRGKHPDIFHEESIVDLVKKYRNNEFCFPDNIDVVTGGFPCQDFSVAGKRNGFNSHKNHYGKKNDKNQQSPTTENRGQLYIWMREVINITKPKVFIAENVKGLVSLGNIKEIIENDFRTIDDGYVVVPAKVLNAKHFGVQQNRERIFFIGLNKRYLQKQVLDIYKSKVDLNQFDPYPKPTHSKNSGFIKDDLLPFVTLEKILLDLSEPEIENNDLAQMRYSRAKFFKNTQGNVEIKLNDVSPTIRAEHHGNIEFRRLSKKNGGKLDFELSKKLPERRLTVRECARIQTFPDNYQFVRETNKKTNYALSASGAYKVIGNAVPPLLVYHIAKKLESLWQSIFKEEK